MTHNIEEAVLLADRIIVLGKNPGRIRTDFQVGLAPTARSKVAGFVHIVDYVYKVLTQPRCRAADRAGAAEGGPARPRAKYPDAAACPAGRNQRHAGDPLRTAADTTIFIIWPTTSLSKSMSFCLSSKQPHARLSARLGRRCRTHAGRAPVCGSRHRRTPKELFAKAALERVTLVRQIKRALESKSNHTLPDEFFHDTLDEHFTERKRFSNWRRPSTGGAMQVCSTTMPQATNSIFRTEEERSWVDAALPR